MTVAERVKIAPNLVGDGETVCNYVYLVGQPRWAGPACRFFGDLPDESGVIEATRIDGRGKVSVLFDPDAVTVLAPDRGLPAGVGGANTRHEGATSTAQIDADDLNGGHPRRSMGEQQQSAQGRNGDFTTPRVRRPSFSHKNCSHARTRDAREKCRKERAQLAPQ